MLPRTLLTLLILFAFAASSCSPEPLAEVSPTAEPTVSVKLPTPKPTTTPTVAPPAPPAPTPTPAPSLSEIRPNELGEIMVLEYHVIGDEEERWTRSRANFRSDLEYLYRHGYRLSTLTDIIENRISTPVGKTPVVLTFDDSNQSQFQFIVGQDGDLEVDPTSALGILENFIDEHPDFGRAAVFCVLPGADPPNDLFGQKEYQQEKLQYLAAQGYEICNHTLWHATLTDYGPSEIVEQIALAQKAIQDAVPGYKVTIFNPPHGAYPANEQLVVEGSHEGISYRHLAALKVGAGPMTAPDHRTTDFIHIPRIQMVQSQLDIWFPRFEQHPEARYVSDGNPDTVVFPTSLEQDYRPSPGAEEEPSPDPNYKIIRLR